MSVCVLVCVYLCFFDVLFCERLIWLPYCVLAFVSVSGFVFVPVLHLSVFLCLYF